MDKILSFLNACPGAISQGIIWGIMGVGVFITFKVLDYADLTVDSSLCTGGAVSAVLIGLGFHPLLTLPFALLAGMLAGLVTGLLHTRLQIPAILSGILTQLALYSVNIRIMGRANVSLLGKETIITLLNVPHAILIGALFAAGVILLLYWFFGTEMGCAVRATGDNERMARALGVNTDTMKVLGLVISNGMVGLAGALLAQYQGYADAQMGRGAIVIGLASVIIGEVLIGSRRNFGLRAGKVPKTELPVHKTVRGVVVPGQCVQKGCVAVQRFAGAPDERPDNRIRRNSHRLNVLIGKNRSRQVKYMLSRNIISLLWPRLFLGAATRFRRRNFQRRKAGRIAFTAPGEKLQAGRNNLDLIQLEKPVRAVVIHQQK